MSAFSVDRLRGRELGMSPGIGSADALARSLYCSMKPVASWDSFQTSGSQLYGGIFNLEFSPGGSLLVAACEKKSVLIFDPLTHKKIHTVSDAHSDCVNCVKFLDGRMFATCSDDTTIALWDVRNLKKKIRTLSGHSNWVKNIEYSVKDNLLVTSGLDGSIYTWDINCYTEWSLIYHRVFHASGLMRCRISPDASQMVMCTTGGLLIIIHNLNLSTLAQDLQGFKPNLYRLMQMSQQLIPIAACYDRLFDRKRNENRVEFVTDFPEGNDAEVVSSLQIHPQGWSALSRNISHDDRSEWTCIHDIQADTSCDDKSVLDSDGDDGEEPPPPTPPRQRTLRCTLWRLNPPHSRAARGQVGRNFNMQRIMGINTGIAPPWESRRRLRARPSGASSASTPPLSAQDSGRAPGGSSTVRVRYLDPDEPDEPPAPDADPPLRVVRQNKKRLLYYAQETNEGKGFIKELCFSSDGRLVCSPYGFGIRLLALNEQCSELPQCVGEGEAEAAGGAGARTLVEVGSSAGQHPDLVVSSKFSPRHHLLVSGCLAGKVVWYQPVG